MYPSPRRNVKQIVYVPVPVRQSSGIWLFLLGFLGSVLFVSLVRNQNFRHRAATIYNRVMQVNPDSNPDIADLKPLSRQAPYAERRFRALKKKH